MKSFVRLMQNIRESEKNVQAGALMAHAGATFERAINILRNDPNAKVPRHPKIPEEQHDQIVKRARAVARGYRDKRDSTVVKNPDRAPREKDMFKSAVNFLQS